MKAIERYHAELNAIKAPAALKEKLLQIPAQYPTEAEGQSTDIPATKPQPKKGRVIAFPTLPKQWKRQAIAAVACFAIGVFATDALGWQVMPRMGSSASDNAAPAEPGAMTGSTAAGAPGESNVLLDFSTDVTESTSADAAPMTISEVNTRSAAVSRQIIYTTNLTLETKTYEDTLAALDTAMSDCGGYLEYSERYDQSGKEDARHGYFTYRVPATSYASFMQGVNESGNVRFCSESADDVTSQYLDLSARITTLTQQRDRLWELQEEAADLTDLLEIENTLTDVLYQIESYQSQLNYLSDQVEYATIELRLEEVIDYTVAKPTAWQTVQNTFTRALNNFVSSICNFLLFLLSLWVWIALALIAVFVYHRVKRKKATKTENINEL